MVSGHVCFYPECALSTIASQQDLRPTCLLLHRWDMDRSVQARGAIQAPSRRECNECMYATLYKWYQRREASSEYTALDTGMLLSRRCGDSIHITWRSQTDLPRVRLMGWKESFMLFTTVEISFSSCKVTATHRKSQTDSESHIRLILCLFFGFEFNPHGFPHNFTFVFFCQSIQL